MLRAQLKSSVAALLQASGFFDENAVLVNDFQHKKLPDVLGKALVASTTNPEHVSRQHNSRRELYSISVSAHLRKRAQASTGLTDLADSFKRFLNTTFDNNRDTLWAAFGGNDLVISQGFNAVNLAHVETDMPDSENAYINALIEVDVTRRLE